MSFAHSVLKWYDRHGRRDLPWQHPRTPYRVWIAEILLQQTQVATAIPYFERFLARFPEVERLAAAQLDEVLAVWSGLGYYARARHLHAAARRIAVDGFPRTLDGWLALPGVGRSTAGAILAQAYGQRQPMLDGNVKRVLARHAGVAGWPGEAAVARRLWREAERRLPRRRLADYTQAIMDLGATLCTKRAPDCARCPVAADCSARASRRIAQIPAPRPRRPRPQRCAWLLLLRDRRGRLFLQRRPAVGLWGALWCVPLVMVDDAADAEFVVAHHANAPASGAIELPAIDHAFTHFDLRLHPLLIDVAARRYRIAEDDGEWLTLAQALARGLPAPLRELLLSISSDEPPCPEPFIASSSAAKPRASTDRPCQASSGSGFTSRFPSRPGRSG